MLFRSVLAHLASSLRVIAILLQPVMTHAPKKMFEQLGLPEENMDIKGLDFFAFPSGIKVVEKGTPIFPRLDVEEEIEYIKSKMSKNEKAKGRKAMAEKAAKTFDPETTTLNLTKKEIRFDKFDKVELKVAEIKDVSKSKDMTNCLNSAWMQAMTAIARFFPELPSGIRIRKNSSAKRSLP